MKLIVGLGNPGEKYANTPHNAGFMMVDMLYKYLLDEYLKEDGAGYKHWKKEDMFESSLVEFEIKGQRIVLMKPLTFMNDSGYAVAKYIKKNELNIEEDLIVVHDDLDIVLGDYKLQFAKSPKGHNGIISLENHLKTQNFSRLRIGIEGRENKNIPGEDYVLIPFRQTQKDKLKEVMDRALKELLNIILG
ncbi:MAG TPA: aminoacyl-tRNA hydrolase [Candidatus Dojkabacteria bacterium]|nr:aminoacyl-tRNA hydrolase [Candidatus Dojkabacteria bacterium]